MESNSKEEKERSIQHQMGRIADELAAIAGIQSVEPDIKNPRRIFVTTGDLFFVITISAAAATLQAKVWTYRTAAEWASTPAHPLLADEGFVGPHDQVVPSMITWLKSVDPSIR